MCRKFTSIVLFSLSLSLLSLLPVWAQNNYKSEEGLKVNINTKEDYSIRFMIWNQVGTLVTEHNSGTLINNLFQDRMLGICTKAKLHIRKYRLNLNMPFATGQIPGEIKDMDPMKIDEADPTFDGRRAISGSVNASSIVGSSNLYDIQGGCLQAKIGGTDKIKCIHSPPFDAKT